MAAIGHVASVIGSKLVGNIRNPSFQLHCRRCLSVSSSHQFLPTYREGYYTRGNIQLSVPSVGVHSPRHSQARHMSDRKKGFFSGIIDNIRQEMSKSKDIKESVDYFREQQKKLEESDALQQARKKYQSIESESKGSVDSVATKMKETLDDLGKSEIGRKSREVVEDLGKTAQKTAESLSKSGEQLSKTQIYKTVSEGVKIVKDELDEATARGRLYKAPKKLKTRDDMRIFREEEKIVEANPDATGMLLHKDSRWHQSWQNFKDNNQFVHKLFDIKMKYDESENIMVRATRTFTDKMGDLFGGMFSKTEMSEVLTEVVKMDPTFDKEKFIKDCQFKLIPNILESIVHGELEILEDWSHEAVYNTIAHPIKQAKDHGYKIDSKVLDVSHVDIVAGKMMEQGPVLVISFNAQQVSVVRNAVGKVMEGDPDKIMRVFHVWAFCRDQTILDPIAAWRLIDLSSSPSEQWL